jgi:predicted acetyltransferase
MTEYCPVPADRVDEFRGALRYAFTPEDGPRDETSGEDEYDEDPTLYDRRGIFEGDDLRCVCKHRWLTARVRGEWHDVAGLSAVGTPPEHRRDGHVRRLLVESLREYRDRDQRLSLLWPFERGFYAKFGWATSNKYATYTLSPESLAFAAAAERGSFRRLSADDWAAVDPGYDAHGEAVALALSRAAAGGRARLFDSSWRDTPYAYGWERDDEVAGYLTYRVDAAGDGKTLSVDEFAYADREAYLNLLYFLYNHDSQVDTVELPLSETTRLLDVADDPADVDCEIGLGPMVRVVDVRETLGALSYPSDGELALSVSDPLVDWNDGMFELAVEDGEATCRKRDDAADADAELDVGALSQLVVGYRSSDALETAGEVAVADEAARETLAALFPKRDVYLREFF